MTQIGGIDLSRVVASGLQIGNAGPVDVEADRRHAGPPERDGDRQADIAETDDCDASSVHVPRLVTPPATLIPKPRNRKCAAGNGTALTTARSGPRGQANAISLPGAGAESPRPEA